MTGNINLYDCLRQFSLEKYFINFQSRGINDSNDLLSLTMQDYPSLGITSMRDREKLFHLIQNTKAAEGNKSTDTHLSAKGSQQRNSNVSKGQRSQNSSHNMGQKSDKKLAVKRTREGVNDSPSLEKINSKTQILEKPRISEKLTKSPSIVRSKTNVVTTEGGYNYGVPSSKPKLAATKRSSNPSTEAKIRVCVRKRPLSMVESQEGELDIVEVVDTDTITVCAPKVAVDLTKYMQKYPFVFDEAFDETCSNEEVYTKTAKPLIKTVFNRSKATCFAYGCTGSGKTHTMLGNDKVQGLYVLAARDMFSTLHSRPQGQGLGLWVSFYEIYCGHLFDLLNSRAKLQARENASHKVCITGLTELEVRNVEELMEVIDYGNTVRSTGSTGVNADSSRSHAVLQLEVKGENGTKQVGRFSFIDLAGSERAADVTDTDKLTRMEGAEINQSLLALKECIRALDQDSKHTPFRQSKLTQVLKDSFVGNSHTCMIANISPNMSASENTLNTLRYADRAKELRKEEILSQRPETVGRSEENFWSDEKDLKRALNNNLPKLKIEEIGSGTRSDNLNKALKRLKMSDMDKLGNIRPKTSAESVCREAHSPARRTMTPAPKVSQSRKSTSVIQSYNLRTPINHLAPTVRPLTCPAVTPSRFSERINNVPKTKSRNSLMKSHNNYMMPTTNSIRNIAIVPEEAISTPQSLREPIVGSSPFVCTKVSETEVNVPRTSNNLDFNEQKKTKSKSKPKRELQEISSRQKHPNLSLECSSSSSSKLEESLPFKSVECSPPVPNTRYSNSIKARLSRLFNSKTTDSITSASGTGKLSVDRVNPEKDDTRIPQSLHATTG